MGPSDRIWVQKRELTLKYSLKLNELCGWIILVKISKFSKTVCIIGISVRIRSLVWSLFSKNIRFPSAIPYFYSSFVENQEPSDKSQLKVYILKSNYI